MALKLCCIVINKIAGKTILGVAIGINCSGFNNLNNRIKNPIKTILIINIVNGLYLEIKTFKYQMTNNVKEIKTHLISASIAFPLVSLLK
jgi:hypothetical protein